MALPSITLQTLLEQHYPAVARIYEQGIATGNATFETKAPAWEVWDKAHLSAGRTVAMAGNIVAGWAALSAVSGRCIYSGVAEVSVYVHQDFKGAGIGSMLLNMLIKTAEANGIWTLQAGILRENQASLALHHKCGFREIGYREKIGKLNGEWRDVILLEKRNNFL